MGVELTEYDRWVSRRTGKNQDEENFEKGKKRKGREGKQKRNGVKSSACWGPVEGRVGQASSSLPHSGLVCYCSGIFN
jgi:hypothetical protein